MLSRNVLHNYVVGVIILAGMETEREHASPRN